MVGVDRSTGPLLRRAAQRSVGQHDVALLTAAAAADDDANLVGAPVLGSRGARGIDRDDDAITVLGELKRVAGDVAEDFWSPKCVVEFGGELAEQEAADQCRLPAGLES